MLGSILQRRLAATGAAVATGVAISPIQTAYAEAPPHSSSSSKKPMYDADEEDSSNSSILRKIEKSATQPATSQPDSPSPQAPTLIKTRSPTPTDQLAEQIRHARLFLYRHSLVAENSFNDAVARVLRAESQFTSTIASLAPPRESGERLLPGGIYVLVSAMAGSIVSRNRGILLRTASPIAVGTVAAWSLLPITMRNVSDLVWEYEKKVPALAENHLYLQYVAEHSVQQAIRVSGDARVWMESKIGQGRETLEKWISKGL
ncbi:MICOS complex subunit [Trichophyton interdigitale]|uniref:MICOS complex subunit n=2 Tax=Trichophyton TaxID=5550 RepID=A0A9P4YMQ9_9EURO|nr:mitochondrial protein [Trichophyton tonsurans CBS 112818]KAF3899212.1 MICOS complex subunit [Trichophyton interdigitale]KAF3900799.1 MICOS complex subunit [Trichophyton interdigitale]KAG8211708.1 MICOS complex subunit [Trichophyton interdigitale]